MSDVGFLWRLIRTTWAWKRFRSPRILRQQAPLIVLAIVHCAIIAVASVFISQIVQSGSDVLLSSSVCGWTDLNYIKLSEEKLTAMPGSDAFYISGRNFFGTCQQYARNCYGQTGLSPSLGCNSLVKPTHDSIVTFNDLCPFQDGVCETSALTLDTGIVDSNDDLGINSTPENRVQFRKVLSCAVIPADRDYSTPWITNSTPPMFPWDPSDGGSDVLWKYYNLGPQSFLGFERPSTFWTINSTTSYDKFYTMLYVPDPPPEANSRFHSILSAFINDTLNSVFEPLPDFNRTDADVMLIAIRNRAIYSNPVLDPVFKATTHRPDSTAAFYTSDLTTGVIGCIEQYQFCNGPHKCSTPSALYSITDDFVSQQLNYNLIQMATFKALFRIAYCMRLLSIQFLMDDDVLLAKDALYGFFGLSTGLAKNQWQIEVQNLHNISMAVMQQGAVIHASPANPLIGQGDNATRYWDWVIQEKSPAQLAVCRNQKARSQIHYSFSVLRLALLFTGGLFVILIGSFAPSIVNYRRHKVAHSQLVDVKTHHLSSSSIYDTMPVSDYRTKEWTLSDPLHLHRMALEEHGIAPWVESNVVPVLIDHQKVFRIPWLRRKYGITFWLGDINDAETPEKPDNSFQRFNSLTFSRFTSKESKA
jgi:hypothetical protein